MPDDRDKEPHVCRRCRASFPNRPGAKCPECGQWNTMVLLREATDLPMPASALEGLGAPKLYQTGFKPWDRTLGGLSLLGIYLLGAAPGCGKSTMCLQILGCWMCDGEEIPEGNNSLYISSEEPREAVAHRSVRLGHPHVPIIAAKSLGQICELIYAAIPGTLVVVDSLQKIDVPGERMGGVSALKIAVSEIKRAAERSRCTVIIISHVTKDDDFAGPKTVEHDVDALSMMAKVGTARVLRVDTKNRFFKDGVSAWMRMTDEGLLDAAPELVLPPEHLPGRVLTITEEGLPAEVQAMEHKDKGGLVVGLPDERVRMVCTLLGEEKDDYLVRADGDSLDRDPLVDLAVVLAIASERAGKPLPQKCCAWGQVTLDGRIIAGSNHDDRAQSARDMGLVPTFSPDSVKTMEDALDACGLLDALEVGTPGGETRAPGSPSTSFQGELGEGDEDEEDEVDSDS